MTTDLKDKTIISWGGYTYFKTHIDSLGGGIKIEYVYANRENCCTEGYEIIDKEEISGFRNPFVIISLADETESFNAAVWLRKHKIPFTHLSLLINPGIYEGRYIRALGGEYTDRNNNRIIINPLSRGNVVIDASDSSNAVVRLGKICITNEKLNILLYGDSSHLLIGNNTSIFGAAILLNTDGKIEIGEDCMFSHHITISQSDQHMIFDADSGNRINYPKAIKIGRHVWIGREVRILGGAEIGDNSIVGASTVTSGKFPSNVIIAGSPAKIIRKNIIWARDSAKMRGIDNIKDCKDQAALKTVRRKKGFISPPAMVFNEHMLARMDFINPAGMHTDLEWLSVSDPDAVINQPEWLRKYGNGYILQSDAGKIKMSFKCVGHGELEIALRGICKKDKNGRNIPCWVNYTYFIVNGETIFSERKDVWHDKPFKFKLPVNDGDIIECSAAWEEHIE